jgi:hypothetical protein
MLKDRPGREPVAEYLDYDPGTGEFHWIKPHGRCGAGALAGNIKEHSPGKFYLAIRILGRSYPATHIAWLLMTGEWPPHQVDHHNLNSLDNIWTNLRLATVSQNGMNRPKDYNKTSSNYKGVYYSNTTYRLKKPWYAQINHRCIGTFASAEEAARAYDEKAVEFYGEFAYLNFPKGAESEPK